MDGWVQWHFLLSVLGLKNSLLHGLSTTFSTFCRNFPTQLFFSHECFCDFSSLTTWRAIPVSHETIWNGHLEREQPYWRDLLYNYGKLLNGMILQKQPAAFFSWVYSDKCETTPGTSHERFSSVTLAWLIVGLQRTTELKSENAADFQTLEPPLPTKFQHFTACMLDLRKGLPWEYRVFLKQSRNFVQTLQLTMFPPPESPSPGRKFHKGLGLAHTWLECSLCVGHIRSIQRHIPPFVGTTF